MKLKLQSLENKVFEFESRGFPSVAFENGFNVRLTDDDPTSSLQRSGKIVPLPSRCLFPRLAPPSDRWCDVLRFVPSGNVSSSSTLQIFRKANHHTPSIAFRHLPPRKDVVNQCLDFGKSPVEAALLANRSVRSFSFTPACLRKHINWSFRRWLSTIGKEKTEELFFLNPFTAPACNGRTRLQTVCFPVL